MKHLFVTKRVYKDLLFLRMELGMKKNSDVIEFLLRFSLQKETLAQLDEIRQKNQLNDLDAVVMKLIQTVRKYKANQ